MLISIDKAHLFTANVKEIEDIIFSTHPRIPEYMEFHNWLIFSSIALVATITPGPAVLLVTTHSIGFGLKAVFTILGNISGLFIMSLLSVLGLSALVLYSSTAFTLLKFIGALYLIYLGVKLWRNGFYQQHASCQAHLEKKTGHMRLYFQGLAVALSNPKAIAFTTALFPQFINHNTPLIPQFTILVVTFMLYSFVCLALYGWLSTRTREGLRNSRFEKIVSRIFAALFIGSGIGLATTS